MEGDASSSGYHISSQLEGDDCDYVGLTNDPIDILQAYNFILDPFIGASSIFIGTTRNSFKNKKVIKLSYEAYQPMALKEMKQLCTIVRTKYQVNKIFMVHRLGEVPIQEASVVIAVSSVHRKEALEGVEVLINTLKERVPIWKKEIYEDGGSEWKENKECHWKSN